MVSGNVRLTSKTGKVGSSIWQVSLRHVFLAFPRPVSSTAAEAEWLTRKPLPPTAARLGSRSQGISSPPPVRLFSNALFFSPSSLRSDPGGPIPSPFVVLLSCFQFCFVFATGSPILSKIQKKFQPLFPAVAPFLPRWSFCLPTSLFLPPCPP